MSKSKLSPSERRAAKAAKALQRAIRKDNPAKEAPTVGKPVIIDPPEKLKRIMRDKRKPE
jgi:hypothetical protein